MKYHYVYIITNKINHKFYIGKHSTNNLDDGYMGSGIAINNAIQKYGIENFSKRILCFCDSAEDAYKVEEFLVTDNLIKRDDCYNIKTGGAGGIFSEAARKNLSKIRKGRIPWNKGKSGIYSDETLHKMGANKLRGENHPCYNKPLSDEHKKKISDGNKNKVPWNKGTHLTELEKLKLKKPHLNARKPKNKSKWITPDGEIIEMPIASVSRWHPDWVLYEQN